MAKKKSAKKPAAASKKPAAAKPAGKKKAPPKAKHVEHAEHEHLDDSEEIELDATEQKAIDLAESSDEVCDDLEAVVTEAVSQSIRNVYKKRGITLTSDQAKNVALVLFGD
jgi:hypothetical protein